MAGRPPKKSLDYSPWVVDIFDNDPKIDKLMDSQGCIGFAIYFYLCQKAYGSDGYFYSWCYDDAASTARKLGGGAGAKTVEETVRYCLQIGLFDKRLFDEWNILTSRGIQKNYKAAALQRTDKSVIEEYWLLSKDESDGLVFCTLKSNLPPAKSNFTPYKSRLEEENNIDTNVSSPTAKPSGSPPKEKKKFAEDSNEMKLAKLLAKRMRGNDAKAKLPADKFQGWCKHMDALIRIDGRTPKEIQQVIIFSQWHHFWKQNILSARNLRDKFGRLYLAMKEQDEKDAQE